MILDTPTDAILTFSGRLKSWRMREAITQKTAASLLGLPLPTYRNYETGHRTPRGLARKVIEQAIGRAISRTTASPHHD